MGIFDVLKGAKKGEEAESEEEEAPESKPAKSGYRTLLKESAEAGDWDAFADAVAGLCKQTK